MIYSVTGAQGRATTTINHCFATLRHIVRWVDDQPGGIFNAVGLLTRGIREFMVGGPDFKKLDRSDTHRLFKAADQLMPTELREKQRLRRNRAILVLLVIRGLESRSSWCLGATSTTDST